MFNPLLSLRVKKLGKKGMAALVKNDFPAAEKFFAKTISIAKNLRGARYNLAIALAGQKKFAEALYFLEEEASFFGEHYLIMRTAADMSYNSGRQEQAREYYRHALRLCPFPQDETVIRKKLDIAMSDKLYADAVKGFQLFEAGNRLLQDGFPLDALRMYLDAEQLDSTNPFLFANMSVIYLRAKKDPATAEKYMRKARELNAQLGAMTPVRRA